MKAIEHYFPAVLFNVLKFSRALIGYSNSGQYYWLLAISYPLVWCILKQISTSTSMNNC